MKILKNKHVTILALIFVFVTIGIFAWASYLFDSYYLYETFTDGKTHNVDLPINTTTTCKNMCGPPNRCSITGTQCLSDIDCYGCQPNTSPDHSDTFMQPTNNKIYKNDEGGKLSFLAPKYSTLIRDPTHNSKRLGGKLYSGPPKYNMGVDTWKSTFDDMREIHDFTYEVPADTPYLSKYPERYSATGEFIYKGPFAANATMTTIL